MKKRLLCLILSAMLFLSVLPFSVSAYTHSDTVPLPDGAYKTWKQYDSRWTDVILGVDPWYDSDGVYHEYETMGHAGCLISSMAILARAYGLTLADGTSIDPGTLGNAMYDGGSCKYLNEKGASRYDTAFDELIPGVTFAFYKTTYMPASEIAALLANDEKEYVIIAGVNGLAHYVAVDYVSDGEVYICDPGYQKTKLSEYNFTCMLVYEIDESFVDGGEVIPANPTWVVEEADGIRIRKGAGLSYDRVGVYTCGTEIEVHETVEADGYLWGRTSLGWCALRSLDGIEVYCVCISNEQYSVTYHTNGGTGTPEMQYKTAGETLILRTDIPVKEGFTFLGWSTDPSAVSAFYAPGATYNEDKILVLYAVWMNDDTVFAHGIDVSSYQGTVDWQTVAASGIKFVILRAGTSGGKDEMFEQNYLGAKAAGLHVGSYFFTYALTSEEVRSDASLFLEWLDGKTFDMPVFVDVETNAQKQLPEGKLTALASEFQAIISDAGYYCGVYSSETWYEQYLDETALGGREFLWVAKWTLSGTLSQNMSERFAMYQYSETGTVPGIEGAVDLNVCYVDFPSLLRQGGEKPPVVDPPVVDPPVVDPPVVDPPVIDPPVIDPPGGAGTPVKNPELMPDSGLLIHNTVLYGGRVGMTAAEWGALFDGQVFLESMEGEALFDDALIRTGDVVFCGTIRYTIAVRGDLDGNGEVDARDYMMLKRYALGTYELSEAAFFAGCLSGEEITARDYMMLKRHVVGTYDIYGAE